MSDTQNNNMSNIPGSGQEEVTKISADADSSAGTAAGNMQPTSVDPAGNPTAPGLLQPTQVGGIAAATDLGMEATAIGQVAPGSASAVPSAFEQTIANGTEGGAGAELSPGQMLGRCRIIRELGRGGMGAVYLAEHTTLDVKVAIKTLLPEIAKRNRQFVERFMREAKLAARIKHPNIMQVMDCETDEATGIPYIVLEYVDGGSLRDKMRKGAIAEDRAIEITLAVASALRAAADSNIVHRDIKPDNIMLTKHGEVKLADLGIAKEQSDEGSGITMSNAMMGTPAYVSPEQATDAKNVDARADIYSLGATLYYMLVGNPPYEGETAYAVLSKLAQEPTPDPRKKRPELSVVTSRMCMRMMAKDKKDRPSSAARLVAELEELKTKVATTKAKGEAAKSSSGGESAILVALAVVCLAVVGGYFMWRSGDEENIETRLPSENITSAAGVANDLESSGEKPAKAGKAESGDIFAGFGEEAKPAAAKSEKKDDDPFAGMEDEGEKAAVAKVSKPAEPVAAVEEEPADEELVKQAMDKVAKMPVEEVQIGKAVFKDEKTPAWPEESSFRLVGFGDTPQNAEKAACKLALKAVLDNAVENMEDDAAKAVVDRIMSRAESYIRKAGVFKTDQVDGKSFVALELAPKAGKLGKALYDSGLKIRDLYAMVGQPAIGIDIKETVDGKDSPLRRAQHAIEKEMRTLGIAVVDITGISKEKQRDYCDILITGQSSATLGFSAPIPGGTTVFHRYDAEVSLEAQMSATRRKIFSEIVEFRPTGADAKKYLDTAAANAAKKTIEGCIDNNADKLTKALMDEWVSLGAGVDYWIGVSGLEGGADLVAIKKEMASLEGAGKVVPRYYRDGTQYFGIEHDASAEKLIESLITDKGWKLAEHRGTKLTFSVK